MKADDKSEQILALLKQEFLYYEKLKFFLEEQKKIIENKTLKNLMEIIQEKEKYQQNICELDEQITVELDGLDNSKRNECISLTNDIREKIESLILSIISQENYCQDLMQKEKVEIHGKISNLRQGKNVIKGYNSSFLKNSFISKKL
mgnify:FL=1